MNNPLQTAQRIVSTVLAVTLVDKRNTVMLKDVKLIRELYRITGTKDLELLPQSQIRKLFEEGRTNIRFQEGVLSEVSVLISSFAGQEIFLTTSELDLQINFSTYIRRVLKALLSKEQLAKSGVQKINQLLTSYGLKLVKASVALANLSGAKTLSSTHIYGAVQYILLLQFEEL